MTSMLKLIKRQCWWFTWTILTNAHRFDYIMFYSVDQCRRQSGSAEHWRDRQGLTVIISQVCTELTLLTLQELQLKKRIPSTAAFRRSSIDIDFWISAKWTPLGHQRGGSCLYETFPGYTNTRQHNHYGSATVWNAGAIIWPHPVKCYPGGQKIHFIPPIYLRYYYKSGTIMFSIPGTISWA